MTTKFPDKFSADFFWPTVVMEMIQKAFDIYRHYLQESCFYKNLFSVLKHCLGRLDSSEFWI